MYANPIIEELSKRDESIRQALLSSYGLMTAEKILRKLNVRLSPYVIRLTVHQANSFYYHLLKLPAMIIFNGLVYDQAHDLQTLLQQRMIHYLYSAEAKKSEGEPGQQYRAEMEDIRLKLVDFNDDFAEFSKKCDVTERMVLTKLREKAKAWKELSEQTSLKLTQELKEKGHNIPEQFSSYLATLIRQEGIGIELSKAQLKDYQIVGEPNFIQKSMVYLLEKDKELS